MKRHPSAIDAIDILLRYCTSTSKLQYLYTKLSQLRIEMTAEAAKDAKVRAEAISSISFAIAKSTGNKVGGIRSAKTGVFQITSRNSTDVSDYGI